MSFKCIHKIKATKQNILQAQRNSLLMHYEDTDRRLYTETTLHGYNAVFCSMTTSKTNWFKSHMER